MKLLKKFFFGLISFSLLGGIYSEGLKAGLDSQFEKESNMKCDQNNAKFISYTFGGKPQSYACIFDGVVYSNSLKYEPIFDANNNYAGPPIGYYGMKKRYTLGKQTSKFLNSGNLKITLYKEEKEGIVQYTCIANEIGGKCATQVKKTIIYQRIN
tara:strand:+ start:2288 stop:2752 length:465 start_codon:yes stop_codon:yes gene_type:complete